MQNGMSPLPAPPYAACVSPIDWSEHRQPNMMLVPWRVVFWLALIEVAIVAAVVKVFGDPHSSLASAVALSLAVGSLPAGGAAHALRRRKPPLRFGIPATAVIVAFIWGVCAFALFVRTYQAY
jgi:hypothetical protein